MLTGRAWTELRPRKPNALLAYLACRGVPVRRSEVTSLLWPDGHASQANASLRQALRALAASPLGTVLERERDTLGVRGVSDLGRFRVACAQGRWDEAFAVYRGPLLQGFELDGADEFGAWLQSERTQMDEAWRTACRALLREAEEAGRWTQALRVADLLTRSDPLDEAVARDAMRVAAAGGDLHGAVRRFHGLEATLADELGVAPEPATIALLEQLRLSVGTTQTDPSVAAPAQVTTPTRSPHAAGGTHLRLRAPRFVRRRNVIGRDEAVAQIVALLQRDDARLVTLLGPGGVGKTTLVGALADDLAGTFRDGVFIAPLEGLVGPDAVALAAAEAAGVSVRSDAPIATQVAAALGNRDALLVLDGFERHLDEAPTVDTVLAGGAALRVVVTSRERLRSAHEVVFEVPPLSRSDAARLFLRFAAPYLTTEARTEHGIQVVERVVSALGGHPLAIELAAAWVDVLGLDGIETQLDGGWEVLSSDDVDRSDRQRDVRAVIDETWRRLGEADRAAWARLAVVPGSLDPTVAVAVAGTGWRGLRRLVDRSVVRRVDARLELHALIARFGREQAEASGSVDAAWDAALAPVVERVAREIDPVTGRRTVLHAFDLEQALEVWRWSLAHERWPAIASMARGLPRALERAARPREASRVLEEAVARLEHATGPGRDLAWARCLAQAGTGRAQGFENATQALRLARRLGDDVAAAYALARLTWTNRTDARDATVAEARAAFERGGDQIGLAMLLVELGGDAMLVGDYAAGGRVLDEALELNRALGDPLGEADVHDARATLSLVTGDTERVHEALRASRALATHAGDTLRDVLLHTTEAWLAFVEREPERAAERIATFEERMVPISDPWIPVTVLRMGYHARFGPPEAAAEHAHALIDRLAPDDRPHVVGILSRFTAASAAVALGDAASARQHVGVARRMLDQVSWPRFVPHLAFVVARLAEADGRREEALALLVLAAQHPALECLVGTDVQAALERLGGTPPPSSPDAAPPDDATLLAAVDAFLGASHTDP